MLMKAVLTKTNRRMNFPECLQLCETMKVLIIGRGPGRDLLVGQFGADLLSGGAPGRSIDRLNGGQGRDRQTTAKGPRERCISVEVARNCR